MALFILQIIFLILFSFPVLYAIFLWKRALCNGMILLELNKMNCGLVNVEEFEKMDYVLIDWDTMVLVEYMGVKVRMTEFERLWVWPTLTRKEKELQIQKPKDSQLIRVEHEMPDGTKVMVKTQPAKYNAGAIENEKIVKAKHGGRI